MIFIALPQAMLEELQPKKVASLNLLSYKIVVERQ